jgi:parallel beta-helix repeat protein
MGSTLVLCALFVAVHSQLTLAMKLCVNPGGSNGCYSSIQDAVNHASANALIQVAAGTYTEQVTIGMPLSLIGAGAKATVIDATGLAHGIFVDGFDNPGLHGVTVIGFTIENAQFEGVLVVSASHVVVRDNSIVNNDAAPGLLFTGANTGCPDQPGSGTYETDETGDCGGAIHLVGAVHVLVSGNFVSGNADGILISDETGESRDNIVTKNTFENNPLECGIVLASHPPNGHTSPPFAPHFGVHHNTIVENVSSGNGVAIGGSGLGFFSDGAGPGRVSDNVAVGNLLTGNGIGGVNLHTHVGPAFGAPADNMDGNVIVGNIIHSNLADTFDTATPGRVGININSGGGGSPVRGTVISRNTIWDEDIDVAINTPAAVQVHQNNLLGAEIGVGDVCTFDGASICSGSINATLNYWGCSAGPNEPGCTSTSGADITFAPWLSHRAGGTR